MAKKKAKKAGRPPLPEEQRLASLVTVRFTEEDHAALEEAASFTGSTIREFVRSAASEKARRVLGRE